MASFSIWFKSSAEKDLRRLPRDLVSRVMDKIEELRFEPFPNQSIKISGAERHYRLRLRDYRIAYEVEAKEELITIHYVRHRSVVYRDLWSLNGTRMAGREFHEMCNLQKASTKPSTTTVTLERDCLTMVVKCVPAQVCPNCGEAYIDKKVTAGLLRDAEERASTGA
jgi:mRNA interferase RelE/StbE